MTEPVKVTEVVKVMRAVKGTRDILPPSSAVWNHVEAVAREVFRTFNYQEIRTPIFEETALFARSVGEDTDIVGKEMYTWEDRDGSSLTLRPESTASVMRAYIEHRLDQIPGVKKFYYMGPMFRRERPQKGRYRQFYQIGAEAIGSESPIVDAEVIEMVVEVLRRSGLEGFHLILNSVGCPQCRPAFMALLREKLAEVAATLCADCQRRTVTNPLRVLDCKIPGDQATIDTLPSILDHLCTECHEHFKVVQDHLHNRGIAYEIRPRMVRGLDYYMRTTFEVTHGSLGAQNSVLGGGRYDGLAESLGSRVPAPGIGFSIGEDRLVMSVEETHPPQIVDLYLVPLPGVAEKYAGDLAAELRAAGISVERSVDRKLKRALEVANKAGARFVLILGEDEIASGTFSVKNMATGEQLPLRREQIIEHVREHIKNINAIRTS
jgi:histidyl-tRNA synthetase